MVNVTGCWLVCSAAASSELPPAGADPGSSCDVEPSCASGALAGAALEEAASGNRSGIEPIPKCTANIGTAQCSKKNELTRKIQLT